MKSLWSDSISSLWTAVQNSVTGFPSAVTRKDTLFFLFGIEKSIHNIAASGTTADDDDDDDRVGQRHGGAFFRPPRRRDAG